MFCVRCGKDAPTIKGRCIDCFLDGRKLAELPPYVDLERCTACGEFFLAGRWQDLSAREAVEEAALAAVGAIEEARVREVCIKVNENDPRNYEVELELHLDIDGNRETALASTIVRIKNAVCKRCSRQLGNYYESILQIRGPARDLDFQHRKEILESVLARVDQLSKESRDAFVSKVEEIHGGLDFYLSSISMGRGLARDLVHEYGAELKESSTLVGRKDDGTDMHRVTYLVRLPFYKEGDVLLRDGNPLLVQGVSRDAIRMLDLRSFRPQAMKPSDMKSLRMAVPREDVMEAILVSASEGEAQVLHPLNMRTVDIRLPPGYEPGETLPVAEIDGELLLLP